MTRVTPPASRGRIDVIANFPQNYFLENLVVRADRSLLITVLNQKELWYVPTVDASDPVEPLRLQSFDENVMGICEIEPEIFLVALCNFYTTHESYLYRLDLNGWQPGTTVAAERVFTFPERARGLNGMCRFGDGSVLVADCFAGLIWRVDQARDGSWAALVWLEDSSMGYFPGAMTPEQPGVNGVRYAERSSYVYWSCTAKKLFMRAHVNPWNHDVDGAPELVSAGKMGDDFCLDEVNGYAYLTTHRQNTVDRISMDPAVNSDFSVSVAGDPFDERLIGPSSLVWGNRPGEAGRVAFVTSDGGTASHPDGIERPARVLRLTLPGDGADGADNADGAGDADFDGTRAELGGRLPLLPADDATPERDGVRRNLEQVQVPEAEHAGYLAKDEQGRYIGPFNLFLRWPKPSAALLQWANAQIDADVLSPETRQVVTLAVGAVWNAGFETYAHVAAARSIGLSEAAIDAVLAEQDSSELSHQARAARSLVDALLVRHRVGAQLYAACLEALGEDGIHAAVHLMGEYVTISALLLAFDVPTPQE